MSRAVLLSVNPRWCCLIASGEKTLEIRKTKPKLEVPFKVYIYCTKGRSLHFWRSKTYSYADDRSHNAFDLCGDGKVIGEFVCDQVYQYTTSNMTDGVDIAENEVTSQSCLSCKELDAYEHSAEPKENCIYLVGLYCWHITDLKIYAQPQDLFITKGLKRAPQSWRYVEEGEGHKDDAPWKDWMKSRFTRRV